MAARRLERKKTRAASTRPARRRKPKAAVDAPYHHGSLHEALLKAAATVLARDGLAGLTLRAAAREGGVSHAAPAHHFGDMTGLLSELAAAGFRRFARLLTAAATKSSPSERLQAMGEAYVEFARANPSMFLLMFRGERLDSKRPALRDAMDEAFAVLARGVSVQRGARDGSPPLAMVADVVRSWSLVHGFAMLMIDHRLDHVLAHLSERANTRDLLRAVLTEKAGSA